MNDSKAAFALLHFLTLADGKWVEAEGEQVLLSLANLNLTFNSSDAEDVGKIRSAECLMAASLHIAEKWSEDSKLALLKELSRVAHADGTFDENEMKFVAMFSCTWGLPQEEVLKALFS